MEAWDSKARNIVIVAGRRWGKSEFGVWWTGTKAREARTRRKPPSIGWYVIPTYKVCRPTWRKYQQLLPSGWITKVNGTERAPDSIEIGMSRIEFKTAEKPENLVAEGLDWVWIDEAGIIDEAVWKESIRPALIDRQAPALLTGTPKGKNWFHRMAMRGNDPAYPRIATFGGSTFENPWLNESEYEQLVEDMPAHLIQQEIFAEFLEDGGDVFRNVETSRRLALELFPDAAGYCNHETFVIGVDLARLKDHTVLHGLCREGHTTGFDRFGPSKEQPTGVPWPLQKERIVAAQKATGATLVVDASGIGDVIVQDLELAVGADRVLAVKTGPNKAQLIDALSIALDQLKVLIPDEQVVVNELKAFGYEITAHGNIRYSAPEDMHDDCVIALALGAYGLLNAPPPVRLWTAGT